MNRRSCIFGLMGGIALALSLTATPPARAQAASQPQCTTVDLTTGLTTAGLMIGNDCNGEGLTPLSGTLTTCVQAVFDATGGGHAIVRLEGGGIVVSDSGTQYTIHINVQGSEQFPSSGTAVLTGVGTAELIGQGSVANEVAEVLLHVTADANGNLTAEVDSMAMHCQG